jgi:predicted dinucleotide-binding enzyme
VTGNEIKGQTETCTQSKMKIGILGTGMVGEALGTKLVTLGHKVMMGSRTETNETAAKWVGKNGAAASQGTFASAAAFGSLVFLCTKGEVSLEVAKSTAPSMGGKILVDVSNPLDFSHGMPPSLLISNTTSLGEEIQKAVPAAKVVKTLHIVNCEVMVEPAKAGGEPTMFVSGNDGDAKAQVVSLLKELGWRDIIDLGDITTARTTEMLVPLWVSLFNNSGNPRFAFKVIGR